ncbi:MAG: AbrB/MazE/SpoVT family DNA-binding domain-containing protein [Okeania sp. SIO3B5]|uniref:AbrB/MazE/SpoVT family DNA-binding domain-containing protein n=1 Tax=Okeania sp. SIO3B5 TaxID=2607811 RepID=UPI00140019DD|nr:AbrB/MazE/SpoVT family DNA-binding domain-containing protein [Okeania sp. SIO3B5]NEO57635.1 AbrB/MazE/SpoVT family DNA-binding domain-containing protein [Okeania sp. SIO3B5]
MKIDTEGKITIPPEIQNLLEFRRGTEVELEVIGNTLQIRKLQNSNLGKEIITAIRGKATNRLTTNEIMQLTREEL